MSDSREELIKVLAESNTRLLVDTEVLWKIICAFLQIYPDKPAIASAIRESAENLLDQWADHPSTFEQVSARINQALEACGESPGEPS